MWKGFPRSLGLVAIGMRSCRFGSYRPGNLGGSGLVWSRGRGCALVFAFGLKMLILRFLIHYYKQYFNKEIKEYIIFNDVYPKANRPILI